MLLRKLCFIVCLLSFHYLWSFGKLVFAVWAWHHEGNCDCDWSNPQSLTSCREHDVMLIPKAVNISWTWPYSFVCIHHAGKDSLLVSSWCEVLWTLKLVEDLIWKNKNKPICIYTGKIAWSWIRQLACYNASCYWLCNLVSLHEMLVVRWLRVSSLNPKIIGLSPKHDMEKLVKFSFAPFSWSV